MGMSVERLAALATIAAALVTIAAFCGLSIAGNLASRARSSPDPIVSPATPTPVAYPTATPATPAPAPGLFVIVVKAKSYHVQIQSPGGSYINLELHKGTVINPVGTILAPGMHIAVRGTKQPDGSVWTDQVDVQPPE
jgi:hypothetical protein